MRYTYRAFAELFLRLLVGHGDPFTTRTVSYGKVMKVITEIVGVDGKKEGLTFVISVVGSNSWH